MAEGELQVADEQYEVESGGCDERESSEPMAEGSPGHIVGQDSNLVIDDSTNDKIGILSHEGTDVADGVCQGDGLEQSLDCGVKTPQKAPNEANLESTQSMFSQGVESENSEPQEANEANRRRVGRLSTAEAKIDAEGPPIDAEGATHS